jgi:serine/threonine protein kinase
MGGGFLKGRSSERVTTQERAAPLGDLIGKRWTTSYRIDRLIGCGGMGEVWAATSEEQPGRQLAVKVISFEFASHRDALERFFGEARAASALDDPNVIEIYDTGRLDDGRPALIMKYIDGPSLQAMVETHGPLSIDQAGQILIQVASALRSAHARSITHRDIKPSNILVTSKWGRVNYTIVVDFGIAKLHDPQLAGKIRTRTKTFIGTPGFASPEQALGKPVDSKADIYALGVVMYYVLTGRLPYPGDSELGMLKLQIDGAPYPDLNELRPDIPAAWNVLVDASLDLDPKKRPTAVEFAKRIAAGMANGKSLLQSLAPNVAVQRGPSAVVAVTLSNDVPTALSQLGLGPGSTPRRGRPSRSVLALALAGPLVGSFVTIAAMKLWSGEGHGSPAVTDTGSNVAVGTPASAMTAPTPDAAVVQVDAPKAAEPPRSVDAGVPMALATAQVDAGTVDAARPVPPPIDAGAPGVVSKPPDAGATKAVRTKGRVSIHASPFADIYINGRAIGTTPIDLELPSGSYRVRLVNAPRGQDVTISVVVSPNKPVIIEKSW